MVDKIVSYLSAIIVSVTTTRSNQVLKMVA